MHQMRTIIMHKEFGEEQERLIVEAYLEIVDKYLYLGRQTIKSASFTPEFIGRIELA